MDENSCKIMMKYLYISILISCSFLPLQAEIQKKSLSTKTAVIFNTSCAKCHEGGCSGRLTFYDKQKSAVNHIQRYSNSSKLSEKELKEFFTLLNYMKKECKLLMPNKGALKYKDVIDFSLSSSKGYFIPFGNLKAGKYSLSFIAKENIAFRMEIISENLDYYFDRSICTHKKKYNFSFTIDKSSNNFLRILSKKPFHITAIELKRED